MRDAPKPDNECKIDDEKLAIAEFNDAVIPEIRDVTPDIADDNITVVLCIDVMIDVEKDVIALVIPDAMPEKMLESEGTMPETVVVKLDIATVKALCSDVIIYDENDPSLPTISDTIAPNDDCMLVHKPPILPSKASLTVETYEVIELTIQPDTLLRMLLNQSDI